ncbi:phosphate ABC transporter permease subunit PstC [Thalassotalea crassostreae]|uniref:phosphate ABC transporter permease subunit PstC n=1 Tax=Thalassotalea crassostreae TaxID=1763536 RepID=UPI0008389FF7|nr:phosphate ABC transporter permease subunit PstC [Thalassotalea crassostreae]
MNSLILIFILLALTGFSYFYGKQRAIKLSGGVVSTRSFNSLPKQFGLLTALCCGLPALVLLLLWAIFEPVIIKSLVVSTLPQDIQQLNSEQLGLYFNDVYIIAESVISNCSDSDAIKCKAASYYTELSANASVYKAAFIIAAVMFAVSVLVRRFHSTFKARHYAERTIKTIFLICSIVAVLTTLGIVGSVLFESLRFFSAVSPSDFLFGSKWSPQIAMHAEQVASSGAFGAVPLFTGTLLITCIAMLIAAPIGLMTAIYLSQYASDRVRGVAKPMLEILAGVPTVVYGFFAALTVAPIIRSLGESIGLSVASESALAAGLVMGIMIIPFVSSLSDDAINAVPKTLKEGSLAMGATESETIKKVLLPAALPGIMGAMLLAVSRAIGETMIVVMAAGLAANLTANPLQAVTTVTVQIVTLLTGDQEFDSPKTLAAFALGLMLFVSTLVLNIIALKVTRKYREQYE